MKKIKFIAYIIPLLIIVSCNKYLDVTPKGILIPETVSDYEGLLNSETQVRSFANALYYASDDIFASLSPTVQSKDANAYFWRQNLDTENDSSPAIWGVSYRAIYNTNVIINNIMNATGGTETKKKEILGEALVYRADLYMNLLTAFSKAYDKNTAETDPGLPLVTSEDVTTATPPRSSLQATMDSLINDLTVASAYLPERNINRSRITKYVAYGVLSRVYLYMEDYPNAQLYAEKALAAPHEIRNYNDYFMVYEFPEIEQDPEILWIRITEDESLVFNFIYSQNLVDAYEPDDLRFQFYGEDYFGNGEYYRNTLPWQNVGITFPEMILTQAEALAHQNDISGAMDLINGLREKRIADYAYEELSASNQEEALDIILLERRRELAFGGTRWFDMKRLAKQGRMPSVKRYSKKEEVLATLEPTSPNYTFEIPSRVLLFNPTMKRNH